MASTQEQLKERERALKIEQFHFCEALEVIFLGFQDAGSQHLLFQ